jgi:hypothetical protein
MLNDDEARERGLGAARGFVIGALFYLAVGAIVGLWLWL